MSYFYDDGPTQYNNIDKNYETLNKKLDDLNRYFRKLEEKFDYLEEKFKNLEEKYEQSKKENGNLRSYIIESDNNINREIFFDICKNQPEKLETLLKTNKFSQDIFNSVNEKGKTCLDYIINHNNDYSYTSLLLDSELLTQETFNRFDLNSITLPEPLNLFLNSKFMTQEKFNTIDLNINKSYEELKLILKSKFMTQEKFNTINLNITRCSGSLKLILELKFTKNESGEINVFSNSEESDILENIESFMTLEKFNTIDLNRCVGIEIIKLLLKATIIKNGTTLPLMTKEKINTINFNKIKSNYYALIKLLLETNFMTKELFNTININDEKNKDIVMLILNLNNNIFTQEKFNSIDLNRLIKAVKRNTHYSTCINIDIDKLKILLISKFMTQERFDSIDFNYIFRYSRNRCTRNFPIFNDILDCKIKTNGSWKVTENFLNSIDYDLLILTAYEFPLFFSNCIEFFKKILNYELLSETSFNLIVDSIFNKYTTNKRARVYLEINGKECRIEPFIKLFLNNKFMTENYFNTKFSILMDKVDTMYCYSRYYNDYKRIKKEYCFDIDTIKEIINHKFVSNSIFDKYVQDLIDTNNLDMVVGHKLLTSKFLTGKYIYTKSIKGASIFDYRPLINIITKEHLKNPFFTMKLNNQVLDFLYDKYHKGGKITRMLYGNKYYNIRNNINKSIDIICKFMYNSYFGPNGIFYQKQLEKID